MNNLIETNVNDDPEVKRLYQDISQLIDNARNKALHQIGKLNVLLYWHIGKRIDDHVLNNQRAVYGAATLSNISKSLHARYGRGFSKRNIERSIQFVRAFPDEAVIDALSSHLKWTHFISLLSIDNPLKRDFYAEMCRIERWNTRLLDNKVASMLFERTAIAKKPEEMIRSEIELLRDTNELSPDWVMQDPYIFENLFPHPLKDEKTLEDAIINDIESFLLSMGNGFAFLERQKVIEIDGEFFRIDLLFYHRILKRLIVIELKQGRSKAADKGQIELYLRWLEKHEMQPGENKPMGIVMCSQKSEEHIELLELDNSSIRVAQFLSELPPKDIFKARLHEAVKRARDRFETKQLQNKDF